MRRRRFLWPIFVVLLAAVVWYFDRETEPARTPVPPRPRGDLNVPGMQMRAAPTEKPAAPPAPAPVAPVAPSASDPKPVLPTPDPQAPPAR
jgi:hypothetical protein